MVKYESKSERAWKDRASAFVWWVWERTRESGQKFYIKYKVLKERKFADYYGACRAEITRSRVTHATRIFLLGYSIYDRIIIVVIALDFDEWCQRRNVVQIFALPVSRYYRDVCKNEKRNVERRREWGKMKFIAVERKLKQRERET